IIGLIGVGGYMILTHFQAPHGDVVSISNVWSHGGLFPKGVSGDYLISVVNDQENLPHLNDEPLSY
ncbi:hypothetical protein IAF27_09945, partial [Acinetobacter baumannii]|nr:hypothetical protein [Acinetobacter baumannii]